MASKYEAIFRSRWRAVLWSAGVLLTAYCTVPGPGEDDSLTAMAKAVHGEPEKAPARHVNPWAIDK